MLRELLLENFKCFEHLKLPFAELTVLSGINSGGKSSVIQSLVLLGQTLERREWGHSLLLEGDDLALGSVQDVVNHRSARRSFRIGVATDEQRVRWTFRSSERRALSIGLDALDIDGEPQDVGGPTRWLLPVDVAGRSEVVATLRRLGWITAERVGPREVLPLKDADSHRRVGARGEMAAGLLYWREDDEVIAPLRLPDVPPTLFQQVRGQMQAFFPGSDLRIAPVDGASSITLRLRSDSRTEFHRPQNVGFGLTQLFPLLVALLAGRPGDVLLIENPEVHLHPRAQQDIGLLIARVAAAGIQVVVETHSDHVLNGIRIAVKRKELTPSEVAIHFFSPVTNEGAFIPTSPQIHADGRLDVWPEGFFDQLDIALAELL